jgi:type I restriction enzyme, S subunit
MNKKSKHTLTPKLRFPEFRDRPYHNVRLGDVAEDATERNRKTLDADVVMGVFKGEGMLPMEKRLVANNISRYKVVEKDWFAYNPMRLNIGSIARWSGDEPVLVSPDYIVFRCSNDSDQKIDPNYLDHFRYSDQWDRFVTLSGDGSVRVRIYFRDLATLRLILPSLSEQQKIADCLGSLDGLIAAEGRKLAALRDHKRGLMQQLFPGTPTSSSAGGESAGGDAGAPSQPRLRFPEFRDKGEWEEKVLSDACLMQAGKFVAASDIREQDEDGLYPCYGGNGLRGFTKSRTHDGIHPLIGRQGALCGNVRLARGEFHATEHAVVATPRKGVHVIWLFYMLDRLNLNRYATGQAQPGLSVDVLEKVALALPALEQEQRRIADCLTALDTQITAQSEKIETLKQHKRGLMQQLFPAPEESEA